MVEKRVIEEEIISPVPEDIDVDELFEEAGLDSLKDD